MVEACVEALCEHLRRMGLNATVESKKSKARLGLPLYSLILGSVRVVNRNIDLVELELIPGEPGGYRCNYVVQVKVNGLEDRLKSKVKEVKVKKGFLRRETVDFRWEGKELAQVLDGDANLRDARGLYAYFLEIKPDKKHQRVRIREISPYGFLFFPPYRSLYFTPELAFPTIEAFEAYDRIAQHIRSIANVRR